MVQIIFIVCLSMLISHTIRAEHEINVQDFVSSGVMMFADTSRGRPFAKDPAVVRFKNRYLMYYSIPPGKNIEGWRIGIAAGGDLVTWSKQGELTVAGEIERNGFCAPGAVVLKGRVHLFYQTYGNQKKDAICHAWSDDGIKFTRNGTNPVFSPTGDWTAGRAIDADVIEHDGKLLLYYATRDPDMKIQMLGVASAPLDCDFGRDQWTQLNPDAPILKPELDWEKKCIEAAAVCKHGGKLYMFYAGGYNNEPQQIGCAVSADGVLWKRLFQDPFLPNGKAGEWNAGESGHPYAFTDEDGTTYLFYQGNNDKGKTWYLSKVKIGWKDELPFIDSRPAAR
jgi:beta-1,2-mannobiose phosphorylase / 1,2-beta-oligomannan phosphorylase